MLLNKIMVYGSVGFVWLAVSGPAAALTPSKVGSVVYIIEPKDGAVVHSPVTVKFGLRGMGVAPAGVDRPGTGHHHLLIDSEVPPLDRPIAKDSRHLHFGAGQTETVIDLPPGRHTLQLILGDKDHIPHDPPLISKRITVTVE
jgi:hypothetical protein